MRAYVPPAQCSRPSCSTRGAVSCLCGSADSKMLNEKNRSKLLKIMCECEYMHWAVDSIPPGVISAQALQRDRYSLNAISHDSAIGLIRMVLGLGFNVTEVRDCWMQNHFWVAAAPSR